VLRVEGFRVEGFRVERMGLRVWGSGFRGQGLGFRVSGFGFRVQGLEWRVGAHKFEFREVQRAPPAPFHNLYTKHEIYRVTSLTRKRTPLGPYRRPLPRVLGGSMGLAFVYERGTPLLKTLNPYVPTPMPRQKANG